MAKRRADRPSRAETAAETRTALLEAGAALLREQPVGTLLNQITAASVAGRAGRTTGAFYHHWEDQESYQRELVRYALDSRRAMSTPVAAQEIHDALARGLALDELVRLAAGHNFALVRDNPYVPLQRALWAKHSQDEEIKQLLFDDYRNVTANLVPAYGALFEYLEVEPRPPFTVELFAVTLTALVEGFTQRAAVEPDAVPLTLPPLKSDGDPWDLFSSLVLALIPMMTMPKADSAKTEEALRGRQDVRALVAGLYGPQSSGDAS